MSVNQHKKDMDIYKIVIIQRGIINPKTERQQNLDTKITFKRFTQNQRTENPKTLHRN